MDFPATGSFESPPEDETIADSSLTSAVQSFIKDNSLADSSTVALLPLTTEAKTFTDSSATGSVQSSAKYEKFTPFSTLPKELQVKTWIHAIPGPRTVTIRDTGRRIQVIVLDSKRPWRTQDTYDIVHEAESTFSAVPHACYNSRHEALKVYSLIFDGVLKRPMYFDFERDTLYFATFMIFHEVCTTDKLIWGKMQSVNSLALNADPRGNVGWGRQRLLKLFARKHIVIQVVPLFQVKELHLITADENLKKMFPIIKKGKECVITQVERVTRLKPFIASRVKRLPTIRNVSGRYPVSAYR